MRLFVGLQVPPNEGIEAVARELAGFGLRLAKDRHITLKFLGELPEGRLPELGAALDSAKGFGQFPIALEGVGAFPDTKYIRVVWVGCRSEKLVALQKLMDSEFHKLGFPQEAREWRGHLTLARVTRNVDGLAEFVESNAGRDFGPFTADSACLVQSTLKGTGPEYSELHKVLL